MSYFSLARVIWTFLSLESAYYCTQNLQSTVNLKSSATTLSVRFYVLTEVRFWNYWLNCSSMGVLKEFIFQFFWSSWIVIKDMTTWAFTVCIDKGIESYRKLLDMKLISWPKWFFIISFASTNIWKSRVRSYCKAMGSQALNIFIAIGHTSFVAIGCSFAMRTSCGTNIPCGLQVHNAHNESK